MNLFVEVVVVAALARNVEVEKAAFVNVEEMVVFVGNSYVHFLPKLDCSSIFGYLVATRILFDLTQNTLLRHLLPHNLLLEVRGTYR